MLWTSQVTLLPNILPSYQTSYPLTKHPTLLPNILPSLTKHPTLSYQTSYTLTKHPTLLPNILPPHQTSYPLTKHPTLLPNILQLLLNIFPSFTGDGKKLASVGLDNDHSIVVWAWRKGEWLATTRGHKDKIFMLTWNPYSTDQLVTVGMKHIKFWTQAGRVLASLPSSLPFLSSLLPPRLLSFSWRPFNLLPPPSSSLFI